MFHQVPHNILYFETIAPKAFCKIDLNTFLFGFQIEVNLFLNKLKIPMPTLKLNFKIKYRLPKTIGDKINIIVKVVERSRFK